MKPIRHLGGFSLPELLIAMLLGLVIAGAALSTLSSASAASKEQRAQAELAQDAHTSLALMAIHLRMAGYKSLPGTLDTHLFGCDRSFENSKVLSIDDLSCSGSASGSSAIALRYEVDEFNSDVDVAGTPTDCAGKAISPSKSDGASASLSAESRFFIQASATTRNPALYCAGNGAGATFVPQSIADNVEVLRVLYGIDASTLKGAREIDALPGARADKWHGVRTVLLCVQMRSDSGVAAVRTAYVDCDGRLTMPPVGDTRLHRTFTQSVRLRNAFQETS